MEEVFHARVLLCHGVLGAHSFVACGVQVVWYHTSLVLLLTAHTRAHTHTRTHTHTHAHAHTHTNIRFTVTFPMDFLEQGMFGTNFSMLGLGDIVIPGIFIALLCRFDHRWGRLVSAVVAHGYGETLCTTPPPSPSLVILDWSTLHVRIQYVGSGCFELSFDT